MNGSSSVLPLLPFPSLSVQQEISQAEWRACIESWLLGVGLRLQVAEEDFAKVEVQASTAQFLRSFLSGTNTESSHPLTATAEGKKLSQLCQVLLLRLLGVGRGSLTATTDFQLLCGGSKVYAQSARWKKSLASLWTSSQLRIKKAVEAGKLGLSSSTEPAFAVLDNITALTKALPSVATVTVASADYLDLVSDIFKNVDNDRTAITENIYTSFIALLKTKHISTLSDNIYHLKSEADRLSKVNSDQPTMLSSILCTTTFLKHLKSSPELASRQAKLLEQLESYKLSMSHHHPLPSRPRGNKGKQRSDSDDGMHIHQAAQVSQVHELFPDLSTSYILKALDFYANEVESVIAALLEPDSLPASLRDQSTIPDSHEYDEIEHVNLEPRPTPPLIPQRASKPEDLDFDSLRLDPKQLSRGKKDLTADSAITEAEQAKSKAAILSALAAFDADDDERDDTYDVADVGGAVDNTIDTDERRLPDTDTDTHEAALYQVWVGTPEVFARDSRTRASNIRQQLKRETNMSDEQIEGWALMLNKDSKAQDRLKDKYSAARAFGGQQRALASTRWQASASTENSETESGPERSGDSRRIGQAGIRGHRDFGAGRGRGRGGSTSGPADDASTQAARKRKEQGRGRGANHRRDARAKKVGRGMGPLPQI